MIESDRVTHDDANGSCKIFLYYCLWRSVALTTEGPSSIFSETRTDRKTEAGRFVSQVRQRLTDPLKLQSEKPERPHAALIR